jgi:hypothetical protein
MNFSYPNFQMMKSSRSSFKLFSAIALLSGCTTTTTVTEVQPASMGKIIGSVQLVEMDCTPSASSAGATVALLGTNYTAITDSSGNWVLDSIPAGYYTIHISKPGFEEYFDGLFPFVGAGTDIFARGLTLARIRNWKVTFSPGTAVRSIFIGPSTSDTSFNWVDTATVVDSAGTDRSTTTTLYYFFGKSPAINYANPSSILFYFSGSYFQIEGINATVSHSGDTLYGVTYPASCNDANVFDYYSGDTLKHTFTGFGPPSNVVKIVLP